MRFPANRHENIVIQHYDDPGADSAGLGTVALMQSDQALAIMEAPHSGRPPEITASIESFLHDWVPQSLRDFKINRPGWTTALLRKAGYAQKKGHFRAC